MAIIEEIRANLGQAQRGYHGGNGSEDAQRTQRRLELIASISLLLERHEEMLLRQAEAEVKEKALAAVEQESRKLRRQMQERLLSADSEVQRAIESILLQAGEHIFQRFGDEVNAVLEGLDARLRDAIAGPSLAEATLTPVEQCEPKDGASRPATETVPEGQPASPAEDAEIYQHEVSLAIVSPLSLPTLMQFYRCLWQMHDLSAVQTAGSLDKGVTLQLRLTEPKALQKVLRGIPCVKDVWSLSSQSANNGRRTIHVALKPPGAEMTGDHEQQ